MSGTDEAVGSGLGLATPGTSGSAFEFKACLGGGGGGQVQPFALF